jgi:hypothetical protein
MLRRRHSAIGLPTRSALAGLAALVMAAGGCADPAAIRPGDIRSYQAAKPAEPPTAEPPAARVSGRVVPAITYTPPAGWTDRGRSGMRLATLLFDDPLGTQEVTIIRAAGSPEANVARWLGQIDPAASAAAKAARTSAALDAAERVPVGDSEGLIVLLEAAAQADAQQATTESADAILAGMIPLDGSSAVFVKFQGPAAAARRARESFTRLVSSIRWQDAAE